MKISSSQLRHELTAAILHAMDLAREQPIGSFGMDTADAYAGAVLERCGFGEVPRTMPNPPELEDLPSVAGDQLGGSLANFTLRCLVLLNEELNTIAPDNARVALLCDAVRLARDYEKVALKAEDAGVVDRLERISYEPPRSVLNMRDRGPDWGKPVRYLSDDRDEPRPNELQIMRGGNGDFYVSVCPRGERTMQGVRLATSGGAAFEVPALVSAMCDAYDALYFAERDARHRGGVRDPATTRVDMVSGKVEPA